MTTIKEYKRSKNIAEMLDDQKLREISSKVIFGYELDKDSRSEWEIIMEKALKLMKQVPEPKSQPNLARSANVKHPLISKAAIDFAARVYPEIIQGSRVVQTTVVGDDPFFIKAERAARVSEFMSYQLLEKGSDWEEGQDKLLHMLPIFGTVFKKTYYDPIKKRSVSHVIPPENLVVNQNIESLAEARRITHVLYLHKNDLIERQRAGLFSEFRHVELDEISPSVRPHSPLAVDPAGDNDDSYQDDDAPHCLLEQHCYLDLDQDGYDEPYIVTIHKDSGEVLRIHHRYKEVTESDGMIKRISPEEYFIDYHFIKNPDGGYYSMGMGTLLTPINESINTVLNQLIDAGTLSNQQSGFIGKGVRLRGGHVDIQQGKYTVLDAGTGVDLRNNIFPIPTKEPSGALFSLLGLLIESGEELSLVTDALKGKQPAQNVPATTIMTLVEQGLKVYNAVVKRIHRSMRKEFSRLFELNRKHLSDIEYQKVLDNVQASVKLDFDWDNVDVIPVVDPSASSDAQRLARARALLDIPTLDPYAVTKYYLKALRIEDNQIDELLPVPDPKAPPPPETLKVLAETEKLRAEIQELIVEQQLKIAEIQIKQQDSTARSRESEARINKMLSDGQVNLRKMEIVADKSATETEIKVRSQIEKEISNETEARQRDAEILVNAAGVMKDDEDN